MLLVLYCIHPSKGFSKLCLLIAKDSHSGVGSLGYIPSFRIVLSLKTGVIDLIGLPIICGSVSRRFHSAVASLYSRPTSLAKVPSHWRATHRILVIESVQVLLAGDLNLVGLDRQIGSKEATSYFTAPRTVADVATTLGTKEVVVVDFDLDSAAQTFAFHDGRLREKW